MLLSSSVNIILSYNYTHIHTGYFQMIYKGILLVLVILSGQTNVVVHAIQSSGSRNPPPQQQHYEQQLQHNHKHGYRYYAPAHKYLPAEGAPSIDAVTTTGHWQYNHIIQTETPTDLAVYEISYNSGATSSVEQQQDYSGSDTIQYNEQKTENPSHNTKQEQSEQGYASDYLSSSSMMHVSNDNAFQAPYHTSSNNINYFSKSPAYAHSHKANTAATNHLQPGPAHSLSTDRYIQDNKQTTDLLTQALPEQYQQLAFKDPLKNSAANFIQMQLHSYESPASAYQSNAQYKPAHGFITERPSNTVRPQTPMILPATIANGNTANTNAPKYSQLHGSSQQIFYPTTTFSFSAYPIRDAAASAVVVNSQEQYIPGDQKQHSSANYITYPPSSLSYMDYNKYPDSQFSNTKAFQHSYSNEMHPSTAPYAAYTPTIPMNTASVNGRSYIYPSRQFLPPYY